MRFSIVTILAVAGLAVAAPTPELSVDDVQTLSHFFQQAENMMAKIPAKSPAGGSAPAFKLPTVSSGQITKLVSCYVKPTSDNGIPSADDFKKFFSCATPTITAIASANGLDLSKLPSIPGMSS